MGFALIRLEEHEREWTGEDLIRRDALKTGSRIRWMRWTEENLIAIEISIRL